MLISSNEENLLDYPISLFSSQILFSAYVQMGVNSWYKVLHKFWNDLTALNFQNLVCTAVEYADHPERGYLFATVGNF